MPAAALSNHQDYRRDMIENNARLLPRGTVYTAVSGSYSANRHQNTADKSHEQTLTAGVFYGVSDSLTIGGTIGGGHEKIDTRQGSRLKGNAVFAGAYAVKGFGRLTLTAGAAYGQASLKGQRYVGNGYDAHLFDARIKPTVASTFVETKYAIPVGERFQIVPKAMLAYNRVRTKGVNETGIGGLNVRSQRANTVDAGAGSDFVLSAPLGAGKISGKLSLDYIHTSGLKDLNASFQGGSTFSLHTDRNRSTFRAGLSGEYETVGGMVFRLGLADSIRKSRNNLNTHIGFGMKF